MEKPVEPRATASSPGEDVWQRRLLPLMVRMVVALALFFFVISLGQLTYLHLQLSQPHQSAVPASIASSLQSSERFGSNVESVQLGLAALLESEAMIKRYELASVTLMAHIWIRYLGFVTGMVMAVIGAVFILGKLRELTASELEAEARGVKLALTSASPGLVLATLGAVLMTVTILAQQETKVTDTALYKPFSGAPTEQERQVRIPDFRGDADSQDNGGIPQ